MFNQLNPFEEKEDDPNSGSDGGDGDAWGHHAEVPDTASDLRQMANDYYAQSDFDTALPLYTAALEAFEAENEGMHGDDNENQNSDATISENQNKQNDYIDSKVIYLCNRATCLYRMGMYEESRTDAFEAVKVSNETNLKAIFRLAKAQMALKEYTTAITTLENALEGNKSNENDKDNDSNGKDNDKDNDNDNDENDNDDNEKSSNKQQGREEIQKLLEIALAYQLKTKNNLSNANTLAKLKTLKNQPIQYHHHNDTGIPKDYKPSIREFKILADLGEGNYSSVVAVRHIVTKETFALKIIEKKKCEDLAKRQHPNVWNEIEMERKILSDRLWNEEEDEEEEGKKKYTWCRRIVQLYHTFVDYSNLYYLESIHMDGWDMWSTIRYKEKMVGTHASLAKMHLFEILEALEFCHERGIVHRDLKAENLLLSPTGHVILIDFGTAKDLIHTEFNGPEFVGTPDFMAPEAVKGESRPEEVVKQKKIGGGADHTLDLWSFGALAFQLLTGSTPFSSPSQYLAYLRIQRGMLCRPMGLTDDKVWDLITKLMKTNPKERLGSDCFEYDKEKEGSFKMINKANGYKTIREHPYFVDLSSTPIDAEETRVFPSLRDLCLRAVSQLVENDSTNLNIDKEHPQGGGSSHDMLRLNKADRGCVMELLEKLRVLSNPRVYRRFFETKREARLTKVRQNTRDYVGLTQMKDKQYQFPVLSSNDNVDTERSDVLETVFPILFMHITNPLFVKKINISCNDEERQAHIAELKKKLKVVNVTRPKLVVASGYLDDECRKLLGKVSESIPVVLNDGEAFYSFWSCGGHGLVLRAADFIGTDSHNARKCEQIEWLKEELEQNEMTRHHAYAFVDCKPDQLPKWLLKKLAKGRVMCLFGLSDGAVTATEFIYKKSLGKNAETEENHDFDDDASQSSADSHEEEDRHMEIIGRGDSSVVCWKLEEGGAWNFENMGQ